MASLSAGGLLARRYRLIDRIGAGGMSVIWRARDEVLDRVVAVKVLAASLAADARFRDMVREEARAAAQLVHPHVATVHDYGETVAPDGTVTAFVVMELLAGEELEARLTAGPLPWRAAVEVCAQVAEALAAAHRLGIVHRDVTPANVMMTSIGAKVLDFGIATHVGAPDEDTDGETFGTPAYVAPERLDGTPAQPATDAYALGVLLYETLTGRVPLPADTWDDLTRALAAGASPPPLEVPGLPVQVAALCAACLARDPLRRPTAHQAAEALRAALREIAPVHVLPARTRRTVPAPRPAEQPGEEPDMTGVPATAQRRVAVLAGAAVAVLAAAVLVTTLPRDQSPPLGRPHPAPTGEPTVPPRTMATPNTPSQDPPTFQESGAPASPPRTAALAEAANAVTRVIDDGVAAGAIRRDAGVDLDNLIRNLRAAAADGEADVSDRVVEMRRKVAARQGEGAITDGYAERLDAALAGLEAAD